VIQSIERAVREVRRCHPGTPVLSIGDLSRKSGGWLRPHRSHQSGLDADIGYYYSTGPAWFVRATDENFDAERTWALVRALIEGGNVQYVFMDRTVQKLIQPVAHDHLPRGVSEEDLFRGPVPHETIIRHEPGHATHFHVRFRDQPAMDLGARLARLPKLLYARKGARR
jgi:murein endopeptidase